MTLKQKAFWLLGIPAVSMILWTGLIIIVTSMTRAPQTHPDCFVPIAERTDATQANCAGDSGFLLATIVMLDIASAAFFFIGVICFGVILLIPHIKNRTHRSLAAKK